MFLIDNNLSPRISSRINDDFPGAIHVSEIGMDKSSDQQIWDYAKTNGLTILTKDSDFYHLLNLNGQPPKVVWLKLGNTSTNKITQSILDNSSLIQEFIGETKVGLLEIF